MNKDAFLGCLAYTGVDTGTSVIGLYSFNSGLSGACFNQIYSTGYNYYNDLPYNGALPLIYNGVGHQTSGKFSSKEFYHINKIDSGNFNAIISMNYSGCLNTGDNNYILFSTVSGVDQNHSGIILGITPSNRLFLSAPQYFSTLSKEITPNDFAFIGVESNRFVNFGLFNVKENTLYNKTYDNLLPNIKIEKLYFGGLFSYPSEYTGYSGNLNEIYLFSGNLNNSFIKSCIECTYATGFSYNVLQQEFSGISITGSYWTGIKENRITGFEKKIGTFTKTDGTVGNFYYDSGLTGNVQIYQSLVPLIQNIPSTGYETGIKPKFDIDKKYSQTKFDLFFDLGLQSGDIIEVYTYKEFNPNVNLDIIENTFPISNKYVQLYGNGLAETKTGESQFFLDYYTGFNNEILGFDNDDILLYDLNTGDSITAVYGQKEIVPGNAFIANVYVLAAIKGNYIWSGLDSDPIPDFIYDVYLNGKKLISGLNYKTSGFYDDLDLIKYNYLLLSGDNTSFFQSNPSLEGQEFKLVVPQPNYIRNLFEITGNTYRVTGLLGFSEQVWKNGIRQKNGIDYFIKNSCSSYTGNYIDPNYSFSLLNSNNNFINNYISFDDSVLLDGLVSYYKLDSHSNFIIKDSHGNNDLGLYYEDPDDPGKIGDNVNAPVTWNAFNNYNGIINKSFLTRAISNGGYKSAALITDNSNLFNFNGSTNQTNFTISFWFKYPESAQFKTQTLFSWGLWTPSPGLNFGGQVLQLNALKIDLEYDENFDLFLNYTTINGDNFPELLTVKAPLNSFIKEKWYHFSLVFKGFDFSDQYVIMYLNGEILMKQLLGQPYYGYLPTSNEFAVYIETTRIGAQNYYFDLESPDVENVTSNNAYVYIDELGIWYRGLKEEEIKMLWNNGNGRAYETF